MAEFPVARRGARVLPPPYRDARRHVPTGRRCGRQTRRRAGRIHRLWRLVGWVFGAGVAELAFLGTVDLVASLVGLPWQLLDHGWVLVAVLLVATAWGGSVWWLLDLDNRRTPAPDMAAWIDDFEPARGSRLTVLIELTSGHEDAHEMFELGLLCREFSDVGVNFRGRVEPDIAKLPVCTTLEVVMSETWVPLGQDLKAMLDISTQLPPSYEGDHLSVAWSIALRPAGEALARELPIWVSG